MSTQSYTLVGCIETTLHFLQTFPKNKSIDEASNKLSTLSVTLKQALIDQISAKGLHAIYEERLPELLSAIELIRNSGVITDQLDDALVLLLEHYYCAADAALNPNSGLCDWPHSFHSF